MEIRTYGRWELAQMYFPHMLPKNAYAKLKRWIEFNPKLSAKIKELEPHDNCRTYTPAQVEEIVKVLGMP